VINTQAHASEGIHLRLFVNMEQHSPIMKSIVVFLVALSFLSQDTQRARMSTLAVSWKEKEKHMQHAWDAAPGFIHIVEIGILLPRSRIHLLLLDFPYQGYHLMWFMLGKLTIVVLPIYQGEQML